MTEDTADVDSAEKVLLLLSEGALKGTSLEKLRRAIAKDRAAREDRLVLVCRTKEEGWSFAANENAEVAGAPDEVRTALNGHEATTYRAPSTGASRHEFLAMLQHLLGRLLKGKASAGFVGAAASAGAAVPTAAAI